MGEAHDYRMRIIIKRPRAVSTEIFPVDGTNPKRRPTFALLAAWEGRGGFWVAGFPASDETQLTGAKIR
jgi:hypothetical protein